MSNNDALPILVVEDDDATRKLLQAVLVRHGFGVAFAMNGRDAIDLLRDHQYGVVILDLMMPEVSGREVIDFISAESLTVPVVVCSAAGPHVLSQINAPVVKAVIRKPFDVDQFVATVHSALDRE